jgi:cytochrome b involved in lipid metabolism
MSSTRTFTADEVAKHTKKGDCWMIYKNKVYDVTNFLEQHPGGEEVLLDVAGKKTEEGEF